MEKELNNILQEADRVVSESSERLKSIPNDKSFGIRDALLVKCRDTIESLNLELDEEKRIKRGLESRIKDLEHQNNVLEHKLRQQEAHINDLVEELEQSMVSNQDFKAEKKIFESLKPLNEGQTLVQTSLKSLEHSISTLQEENSKLRQQLENERARIRETDSQSIDENFTEERIDLEKIEIELEQLYEKKHKCMIKDFEKKQETLKEELNNAIDEIEIERKRYQGMYIEMVEENNQLRQEIKYLQNMLQRKQSQLEKHSQQSLDQLQTILEKKGTEENLGYKNMIGQLEKEKNILEGQKSSLEAQVYKLQETIEVNKSLESSYDNLFNENLGLKNRIQELERVLKDETQEKSFLTQNIEEMKKLVQDSANESLQDPRKQELIKLKYQTLIQSELQKRLRDKQNFKQHLIQDKEAFLAKLRTKDEKIAKLEAEKAELLYKFSLFDIRNFDDDFSTKEKRFISEDTARLINNQNLSNKYSNAIQSVRPSEKASLDLETRNLKFY